ncbi:YuzD family protein [Metabacillus iocasae]|uniref:Disulfide oxidoreductase YuzD n=1 Tax=Priestia iocasae TaxID=2291674 RepID=A0ABS2QYN2_9BACI|nr:YuzD family protein [Metabacillus iocasae]MBM7704606.1 disulfide oxidoreductase YuzD [Metabacillus iocasae]
MVAPQVEICIYGADVICASCVNLPSSKDTYEWLEAALARKFPNQSFHITYVDIYNPPEDENKQQFSQRVIEEEMFYPVVVINGTVVGEGNPKLKSVYNELEKYGFSSANT